MALMSNLEYLSSTKFLAISVPLISTRTIGISGLRMAFKNEINISGCFSEPNIFLNTKSTLGSNKFFIILISPLFLY